MAIGDEVMVLACGKVPYVLTPAMLSQPGKQAEQRQLVGECFVANIASCLAGEHADHEIHIV
jgi:hypothetical protein